MTIPVEIVSRDITAATMTSLWSPQLYRSLRTHRTEVHNMRQKPIPDTRTGIDVPFSVSLRIAIEIER